MYDIMKELRPEVLHVRYLEGKNAMEFSVPRRYTLTHSDRTGHLFLTIGRDFCQDQVSGIYTRLMRDEVLAEWVEADNNFELHVNCHVSGGVVLGSTKTRLTIFKQHMRLVLEALRHGDQGIYIVRPELERAKVRVHFCSKDPYINQTQDYGPISEFS